MARHILNHAFVPFGFTGHAFRRTEVQLSLVLHINFHVVLGFNGNLRHICIS